MVKGEHFLLSTLPYKMKFKHDTGTRHVCNGHVLQYFIY